jgi:hypothetical protein
MTSRKLAAIAIASAMMVSAPALMPSAAAQSVSPPSASTVVPVVLWAVTGAVIGSVAWPLLAGGTAASAAPAGVMSVDAFLNAGALAGAFVGGVGYLLTR